MQEQVPASYKLPKIQEEMGRELYLAENFQGAFCVRFAGREEYLFKEQEENGYQSLSGTGRRQSRRLKRMQSDTHIQLCEGEMAAAEHYEGDRLFSNSNRLLTKKS